MMRIFFLVINLILIKICFANETLDTNENNIFIIDDETTISFSIPNEKFYYSSDIDESFTIDQLKNVSFLKFSEFSGFKPYKYYIKKIKLKNIGSISKSISVKHGINHIKSQFFLILQLMEFLIYVIKITQ